MYQSSIKYFIQVVIFANCLWQQFLYMTCKIENHESHQNVKSSYVVWPKLIMYLTVSDTLYMLMITRQLETLFKTFKKSKKSLKNIVSYVQFVIFKSVESPVELNSLLLKFFCFVTWFDEKRNWRPCKRDLYLKIYCCFEIISQWFKNCRLRV